MKKTVFAVLAAFTALMLNGCGASIQVIDDVRAEGNRIAFVAGSTDQASLLTAAEFTDQFEKKSALKVVSQQEIAAKLGAYPVKIQGPYKESFSECEVSFDETDKKKINEIQKKLGADYLCVIWAPPFGYSQGAMSTFVFTCEVFATPQSIETHQGKFSIMYADKDAIVIGKAPRSMEESIRTSSAPAAELLAEKMKVLKK